MSPFVFEAIKSIDPTHAAECQNRTNERYEDVERKGNDKEIHKEQKSINFISKNHEKSRINIVLQPRIRTFQYFL